METLSYMRPCFRNSFFLNKLKGENKNKIIKYKILITPNNFFKLISLFGDNILNLVPFIVFKESEKYFKLGFFDTIEQILKIVSKKLNSSKILFRATISEKLNRNNKQ